jgi:hypothetical protein
MREAFCGSMMPTIIIDLFIYYYIFIIYYLFITHSGRMCEASCGSVMRAGLYFI